MEQLATQDTLIGAQIGNYEVRNKLGVGGMGTVYLAEHPLIGKKVALKVLHSEYSSNQEVVQRFFHEAKAVNDIQHPNIVDIIDYGVSPSPHGSQTVYFIMEFLDGPTLSELLKREAPLAPERALAIGLQIADALGASHRSGVIHRDLKPDNIILIKRGRQDEFVKVLDFGIAKLTGEDPGLSNTRTGLTLGTPAYMSPEQCEGKGNVDHRADLYALGIVLYEMLTARQPFAGEGYGEILMKQMIEVPAPPSTIRGVIPPHVEALILKALEKDPNQRFQDADSFMQALADPVGYIEARGGLSQFATKQTFNDAPANTGMYGYLRHSTTGQQMAPFNLSSEASPPPPAKTHHRVAIIATVACIISALAGIGFWFASNAGWLDSAPRRTPIALNPHTPVPSVTPGNPAQEEPDPGNPDPSNAARDDDALGTEPGDTDEPTTGQDEVPIDQAVVTEVATATDTDPDPEEMVSVQIESRPRGALVFLATQRAPIGRTPLQFEVPKGQEELALSLRMNGYKEAQRRLTPNRNKVLDVTLRRKRRPPSSSSEPPSTVSNPEPKPDSKPGVRAKIKQIQEDVGLEDPTYE